MSESYEIIEDNRQNSEQNEKYFPFGTRFPYKVGGGTPPEENWYDNDNLKNTIYPQIWKYSSENFSASSTGTITYSNNSRLFTKTRGGSVELYPVSSVLSGTEISKIYYPTVSGGITNNPASYITFEDGGFYVTNQSTSQSSGSLPCLDRIYDENKDIITGDKLSKIKENIDNLKRGNNEPLPTINLGENSHVKSVSDESEKKKILSIYQGGLGKSLDLRIKCAKVSEIMSLLSNGSIRKDNLFLNSTSWKNFKSYKKAGSSLDNAKIEGEDLEIDDSVFLIPENFVFKSGFKYTLGQATEVTNSGPFKIVNNLAGGAAMIESISNTLKGKKDEGRSLENLSSISFNERINRFRNIPYFKDIDNVCIDSLNFNFQYGQYGLYDCYEEVVKPILKLASIFSYKFSDEDGQESTDKSKSLFIDTPYTNKFEVMTKMYRTLFTGASNVIADAMNSKPTLDSIQNLPKRMIGVLNSAAEDNDTQIFTFRIGSSIYGPFYASEVKWEFDFERTNKYGFPFAGNIVISGIKPLIIESLQSLIATGGQIISQCD